MIAALILAPAPLLAQPRAHRRLRCPRPPLHLRPRRVQLLAAQARQSPAHHHAAVRHPPRDPAARPGEPYDSAKVAESERNLRRLGVFRSVKIDSTSTDSGLVVTGHHARWLEHPPRLPLPFDRRRSGLHPGVDRGQPPRHRDADVAALSEEPRPHHHHAGVPAAAADRRHGSESTAALENRSDGELAAGHRRASRSSTSAPVGMERHRRHADANGAALP